MKRYLGDIITCLLIITTGLVIYARIGGYDYILYDDMMSLYVPFVTEGFSLEKVGRIFYKPLLDYLPYQVPVPSIVRLILWELFGNDLGKHHLFSLCLHILCALMLFWLLRAATGKIPESGLCALLLTVHPLNVEAVSWLAGYNGMLEAFFLMAALVLYYGYLRKPSISRYLLIFIPFILGLMSKPSMAVLPFLMILLDYWPFQRFSLTWPDIKEMLPGLRLGRVIVEKLPLILLVPIYVLLEKRIGSGGTKLAEPFSLTFYPGSLVDFMAHLIKVVVPTGLAIGRPDPAAASLWTAVGLVGMLLLISIVVLWQGRTRRYLITGWFWFLIAAAPGILILSASGRPVEDHHLYIPLVGIFILFSFGLSSLLSVRRYGRYLFMVSGLTVLVVLFPLAYAQVGHWENSITIFSHAIAIDPDNRKAHVNLGDAYMQKDEIDRALHHYREFLRISPESALGHTKLANALAAAGRTEAAVRHFSEALDLAPDYVPAYHGWADLLAEAGDTDGAITLYRRALAIDPRLFQTLNNLALALYERGDYREALACLDRAVRINPHYRTAVINRRIIIDSLEGRPVTP